MNSAASPVITLAPGIRAFRGEEGYGFRSYSYALSMDTCTVLIDTTGPELIPLLSDLPTPRFLVLTHRHTRNAEAKYAAHFPLRLYMHPADAGAAAGSGYHDPATDEALRELGFQFLHVPGHTPGSLFIYWNRHGGVLFTGDTVVGATVGAPLTLSLPPSFTSENEPRMREELKALARPTARNVLPLHGEYILDVEPAEVDRMWNAMLS